jgi:hypothetical protein
MKQGIPSEQSAQIPAEKEHVAPSASGEGLSLQRQEANIFEDTPRMATQRQAHDGVQNSPRQTVQRQRLDTLQQAAPESGSSNTTSAGGLPDNLRINMESMSGIALDSVRVHRNSDKPAQMQALAYAQGRDIHLGPGQEKHLPHEAWHVVQQAQGRVQPTMKMKDGMPINDNSGLEHEANAMGAKAATPSSALQRVTATIGPVSGGVAQAVLKVGPKIMEEEHIEFLLDLIEQHARQIIATWSMTKREEPSSPTWVAFNRGIATAILEHGPEVVRVLRKWIASSGGGTAPVIVESTRERLTGERGEKVHWKEFDDLMELTLAVGYELDPALLENRARERELGERIAENPAINDRLNTMRLTLMRWIRKQYESEAQDFSGFKMKFKLGGSYYLGNPKGIPRDWDVVIDLKEIPFTDNIEILHDLMELTSEAGGGSLMQKFGRVLAKTPEEIVYTQIGVDNKDQLYEMTPMRSEFDHGPGGAAWRSAKHYLLKQFEVEFDAFRDRPIEKEMLAIGEIPEKTREERLSDRYHDKASVKLEKAANYQKKAAQGRFESMRDTLLTGLGLKSDFRPTDKPKLHKQSKGRHNVGTRDEYDPVSVVARRFGVPIEAGRSMTTARLLTLCKQALDDSDERELHETGKKELDAVANAIFAYWAAIYNLALTPVHTYHEVMDVARHFGVEYEPFHYRVMDEDMNTTAQVPMHEDVPKGKMGGGQKPVEEVRNRPYLPSREQTLFLRGRKQVLRWIAPNGDCLFNALAATGVDIGDVGEFRRKLANYLRQNSQNYMGFIAGGDVEAVAREIERPGSYFNLGGDMSPLLIADMLGIGFTILNADGSPTDFRGGSGRHLIIRVTNPLPHFHTYQREPSGGDGDEIELTDFSRASI